MHAELRLRDTTLMLSPDPEAVEKQMVLAARAREEAAAATAGAESEY